MSSVRREQSSVQGSVCTAQPSSLVSQQLLWNQEPVWRSTDDSGTRLAAWGCGETGRPLPTSASSLVPWTLYISATASATERSSILIFYAPNFVPCRSLVRLRQ